MRQSVARSREAVVEGVRFHFRISFRICFLLLSRARRVKNRNVFKRLGIKIKDRFQDHHRNSGVQTKAAYLSIRNVFFFISPLEEGKMPDPDIPDSSNSRKSPLPPPPVAVSLVAQYKTLSSSSLTFSSFLIRLNRTTIRVAATTLLRTKGARPSTI